MSIICERQRGNGRGKNDLTEIEFGYGESNPGLLRQGKHRKVSVFTAVRRAPHPIEISRSVYEHGKEIRMAGISWGVETASSGSVFVGKTADTKMFLKDVMGLDFSKHRELFMDRGLDNLETLRIMATWAPVQLQETLQRVLMGSAEELGGGKG
jgi:hypothetical protein